MKEKNIIQFFFVFKKISLKLKNSIHLKNLNSVKNKQKKFFLRNEQKQIQKDENNENVNKKNPKRILFVIEGSIYKDDILIADKSKVIGDCLFKDINQYILEDLKVYPDLISLEADIISLSQVMKIDLNKEKPLNVINRIEKLRKLNLFKNLSEKILEKLASKLKKNI